MTEGENGLTGKVLSTGVEIASGSKPATAIEAWDGMVYTLEANKTYKFFVGGTKWRLAGFRYIPNTAGIKDINRETITNNRYYDLQGRMVTNPTKGLYIVNGKTVVMK